MFASPTGVVRGDESICVSWIESNQLNRGLVCALVIFVGCGLYGAAIGSWRAAEMSAYVAIKLPLLVFLTLLANGLMNGILAQVLGSGLSISESLQSQLMSFMIFGLILGGLSPIAFAMAWSAPGSDDEWKFEAYRTQVHVHTLIIAYAGVVANYKLFRMLEAKTGSRAIARKTFLAWLVGNLFVGAQLSWNLRPFFGSPYADPLLFRADAFDKTFYESLSTSLSQMLGL